MKYVWLVVVLLLAVYGLTQGVGQLIRWIWRPRQDMPAILVLPVCGHCEDVEYRLRHALARWQWTAGAHADRVLLLDTGLDEESRQLARVVCDRLPGVEFCRGAGAFQT